MTVPAPGPGRGDTAPVVAVPGAPHQRRPLVMGILNVTPDSFSDGGRWGTSEAAVARALKWLSEHQMPDDQWEHYYLVRMLKMSLATLVRQRMEHWDRIESVTVELVTDEPGI